MGMVVMLAGKGGALDFEKDYGVEGLMEIVLGDIGMCYCVGGAACRQYSYEKQTRLFM